PITTGPYPHAPTQESAKISTGHTGFLDQIYKNIGIANPIHAEGKMVPVIVQPLIFLIAYCYDVAIVRNHHLTGSIKSDRPRIFRVSAFSAAISFSVREQYRFSLARASLEPELYSKVLFFTDYDGRSCVYFHIIVCAIKGVGITL